MSKPNPFYQDGLFRPDVEVTVIPRVKYPFAQNTTPDVYAKVFERDYNVLPQIYAPKIATRTSWTNLLTYSQDTTNAAWTKTEVTPTISGTAPDGNATLNKWLETTATSEHNATQAATPTAASTFVGVFAQGGLGRNWIKVTFTDFASAAFSAFFDISTGNVGTKSGAITTQITPMGNSQYLVGFFFTPAAGAGTLKIGISTNGSTVSYTGDAAKGVYLWGAQVVAASTVPPYIATTGTTRTISAPNVDSTDAQNGNGDPFSYLVDETDPANITSLIAAVSRKYARIPNTQTTPSSIAINIPSPVGTDQAIQQFTDGVIANLTNGPLGSGYLYSPSTLAYYGAEVAVSATPSGSDLRITWTAHGVTTQDIEFGFSANNAHVLVSSGDYTVVDANTIDILNYATGSTVDLASKKLLNYSPGLSTVRCTLSTAFYLPGVTTGVASLSAIPNVTDQSGTTAFLAALAAGSGNINYQVGQWSGWMGPIVQQTTTTIAVADIQ